MTTTIPQNIFHSIPQSLTDELFETLLDHKTLRIERIVSTGHHNAPDEWYDQDQDEWVLLLQGRARLEFSRPPSSRWLDPGDYLLIPAHVRHRVAFTQQRPATVWLAVHMASAAVAPESSGDG